MSLLQPKLAQDMTIQMDALPIHHELWASIQSMITSGRLVQTYLLIGSEDTLIQFVHRWVALLMCQHSQACGECLACKRFVQNIHPDVTRIQPDGTSPIKIEQIRNLIEDIYQTPQCGTRRYVIIEGAETLNTSSANALLKLLEEPPQHAMFFLLVKHLSDLPATLVSRCQRYVIPDALNQSMEAQIESQPILMADLLALIQGQASVYSLAEKWSKYPLVDVVSWLYLVTASVLKSLRAKSDGGMWLHQVAKACSQETWFEQLDRIHQTSKSLHKRISLNTTLTLNYLLMGYCDVD